MARARKKAAWRTDPAIEALDLAPAAKAAAYALKALHPEVVFTSGRRDKVAQARAMAQNVVRSRQWIARTYLRNDVSVACQKWVDEHPEATTPTQIQKGLEGVFAKFTDADLGRLSKHLSGEAFDIQPVSNAARAKTIKASIRKLAGLKKFLEKEGGLLRWHAQF